jgi:hypothetical protein
MFKKLFIVGLVSVMATTQVFGDVAEDFAADHLDSIEYELRSNQCEHWGTEVIARAVTEAHNLNMDPVWFICLLNRLTSVKMQVKAVNCLRAVCLLSYCRGRKEAALVWQAFKATDEPRMCEAIVELGGTLRYLKKCMAEKAARDAEAALI